MDDTKVYPRIYIVCYTCRVDLIGPTALPSGPIIWQGEVVCPDCGEVRP